MGTAAFGGRGSDARGGTSEEVPEAVGQAVGGGCRSGWGRLLSVTILKPALGVRGTVPAHRLGALKGRGNLRPWQCIRGERVQGKGKGEWREANRRRPLQTATPPGAMPHPPLRTTRVCVPTCPLAPAQVRSCVRSRRTWSVSRQGPRAPTRPPPRTRSGHRAAPPAWSAAGQPPRRRGRRGRRCAAPRPDSPLGSCTDAASIGNSRQNTGEGPLARFPCAPARSPPRHPGVHQKGRGLRGGPRGGSAGGWRRLSKRLGAVTVGCVWGLRWWSGFGVGWRSSHPR